MWGSAWVPNNLKEEFNKWKVPNIKSSHNVNNNEIRNTDVKILR